MAQACERAASEDWLSAIKDYNFTLGTDPSLPGLRGLVLSPDPALLMHPAANKGLIAIRQRLSPFQIDVLKEAPPDVSRYHFVFSNCGCPGPGRSRNGPKIIVYGHDHHGQGSDTVAAYQESLDSEPDALFTPYPSIWRRWYRISNRTRVVFAPMFSPTFFARPILDFSRKPLDVLVVGVLGQWAYPERCALAQAMRLAVRRQGWLLHTQGEHSVDWRDGRSRAGGGMTLDAWDSFLAQSKIVAFGGDRWGYACMKYSEVPANCSLMLCRELPDLELAGLLGGVHYVPL